MSHDRPPPRQGGSHWPETWLDTNTNRSGTPEGAPASSEGQPQSRGPRSEEQARAGTTSAALLSELAESLVAIRTYAEAARVLSRQNPSNRVRLAVGLEHLTDQVERAADVMHRLRSLPDASDGERS